MDNKKRILLVDDEEINLEFFDVMLSKLGFEIAKAENGAQALDLIKRWKPDLIILDNMMPKLSGWEVTKLLKTSEEYREFSEIPIIMFSAMDDVKDKVEGLELGADDYITKPFNFSEVLARIRAILRTRELVGQIEHRDERIRLAEEVGSRLISFTAELRSTLESLRVEAQAIEPECGNAAPFVQRVKHEADTALSKLDALDTAIEVLRAEAESLKASETALSALKKTLKSR